MKNLTFYLLSVFVGLGLSSSAQIQRGNVLIGANLANLNLDLDHPNVFKGMVTPKIGWFVQDKIAVGGYLLFGVQTARHAPTTTDYGIGALTRYYFSSDAAVLKQGHFFGEATIGFGGQSVSDGGESSNGVNFGVGPGFTYFIAHNIGLEGLITYNGRTGFVASNYQNNLNFSLGLQVYLSGKRAARKATGDVQ